MSDDMRVRFGPNQATPPGYHVIWSDATEHYMWVTDDERESAITWDRWAAWRGAWADYRSRYPVSVLEQEGIHD